MRRSRTGAALLGAALATAAAGRVAHGSLAGGRQATLVLAQYPVPSVPAEARAILLLRYVDDLPYPEIARIRGVTVNTVKSQLRRGKMLLRRALRGGKQ